MTISQALISINSFPIPSLFIEKVGVDRELTITDEYTKVISEAQNYRLATADVYVWLFGHVNMSEQEVSFSQQQEIKQGFLSIANDIYLEFDDPKYTGKGTFGYIGDDFNG